MREYLIEIYVILYNSRLKNEISFSDFDAVIRVLGPELTREETIEARVRAKQVS